MSKRPLNFLPYLFIALVTLTNSQPSLAQIDGDKQATQEYVTEAAKLLSIFDEWAMASTDCNYDQLIGLYHPKVTFWPSVAEKPFYGIDSTIEVFKGMCDRNPFLRVTPIDRYVDLLGNTAVVFGSLKFRRMLNEQLTEVPVRFSFTLVKEKTQKQEAWKILHMQSTVIPFDPNQSNTQADKQ